jgi:hypothetical protein
MPAHLRHVHPVVSVSLIEPFKPRAAHPTPVVISGEEGHELDSIIDFNVVRSKRRHIPDVVEFRVKWKGSFADTWREPCDFANAQDTLIVFLQRLTKPDRISVLKALDDKSFALLPAAL